jgi:FAD/FMN-containing dehydrogenase
VNKIKSWGNFPKVKNQKISVYHDNFSFSNTKYLAKGLGRSYGDVGLNENATLVSTENLNKIISFDKETGILDCQSGLSFEDILNTIIPEGWFLPVVPGTRNITIGGAIANDIHGKNHHKDGTFGNYIKSIKLLRSDGVILDCDENKNSDYFNSTIAGLGLTGIIISAEIKLKKIKSAYIDVKTFKFNSLDEYWEINSQCEKIYDYTVSWVDCLYSKKNSLRGIYIAGNHSKNLEDNKTKREIKLKFPFTPPFSFVNNMSMRVLNFLYYSLNKRSNESIQYYKNFFFPLDVIQNWNKAYGKNGFFQYQFVIPKENAPKALKNILEILQRNNQVPALGVLKNFGKMESPGLLSFPLEGVTLALDFPNKGKKTKTLFDELNKVVISNHGRLYPAKDALMQKKEFQKGYHKIEQFKKFIDPKFSSSFWRRVN